MPVSGVDVNFFTDNIYEFRCITSTLVEIPRFTDEGVLELGVFESIGKPLGLGDCRELEPRDFHLHFQLLQNNRPGSALQGVPEEQVLQARPEGEGEASRGMASHNELDVLRATVDLGEGL